MERIDGLNANQVAKELQHYRRYKGKTQKEIKNKVGNTVLLRKELKRLESKKLPKINNDILYNLMLNADHDVLANLCLTNKNASVYCHDKHFWHEKLIKENLPMFHENTKDYYKEYKKLIKFRKDADNILTISQIEKERTDNVYSLIPKNLDHIGNIRIDFTDDIDYKLPFLNKEMLNKLTYENRIPILVYIELINDDYKITYQTDDETYDNEFEITMIIDRNTVLNILTGALYENDKNNNLIIFDDYQDEYLPEKKVIDFTRWDKYTIEKYYTRLGMLEVLNKFY